MTEKLPPIIVTGASGIVGRGFLEMAKEEFLIYAIARRSQKNAGVAEHPNIKWIQVDIGNWISLRWVMHNIKRQGGADYVFHLAAYYDFEYTDNPEYERTNVKGTRYMLEQCKILRVKRFIFAGSTAACDFPPEGGSINEKTPSDAGYDYAVSKKKGEEMVREFSKWFPCAIVRFAAVFTDWCEYGVLYKFLSTWLSKGWNSRILGGKGESAVSYIHSRDLSKLVLAILRNSEKLPQMDTYIASPDGSTNHRDLYEMATRFFFGRRIKPYYIPKFLAYPGVLARDLLGRLIGKRPFERPWMIKYLDWKLDVDASYTRETLSWQPTPRLHILRRLLFMIEKLKSDPIEWHRKNAAALEKVSLRPNLLIYEILVKLKEEIIADIRQTVLNPANSSHFPNYRKMDKNTLDWHAGIIYQLLTSSVRNNDRMLLLDYVRDISNIRFREGYSAREVSKALSDIGDIISSKLYQEPELKELDMEVHDYITMTVQLMIDEVEDAFETFEKQVSIAKEKELTDIEERINQMETFYKSPDERIRK
ncbi:MAG: NAD-dependent epimerase/dehydratase family protein [bacterium]|nr:NAD-dependent epimerase/dehydratase family protein [bacterium]